MNSNKLLDDIYFKMKEYDIYQYFLSLSEKESGLVNDLIASVLENKEHMRQAIKLVKNSYGDMVLKGIITPQIMLTNFDKLDDVTSEKLLRNILFGYKDKKHKVMHISMGGNETYLSLIVRLVSKELSYEIQEKITEGIIDLIGNVEENVEAICMYLFNYQIGVEQKQVIINKLHEEGMLEGIYEQLTHMISCNLFFPSVKSRENISSVMEKIESLLESE